MFYDITQSGFLFDHIAIVIYLCKVYKQYIYIAVLAAGFISCMFVDVSSGSNNEYSEN